MRPGTVAIKNHLKNKKDIIGAEIGVFSGDNAYAILVGWPEVKCLHLIDNYVDYGTDGYLYGLGSYGDARVLLESYKDRIKWHLITSLKASKLFADNSLDFTYIDADHQYESVVTDLSAWWPKIKVGGGFAGHDYNPKMSCMEGVIDAVDNFVRIHNLKLNTETREGTSCWWIIK